MILQGVATVATFTGFTEEQLNLFETLKRQISQNMLLNKRLENISGSAPSGQIPSHVSARLSYRFCLSPAFSLWLTLSVARGS